MNTLHVKYVLVGGGIASSAAARAIRQRDVDGSVLLVGQEVNRPYYRPFLSKDYLLGSRNRSELFTLPDGWFAQNRVELRTARRASQLDPTRNSLTLDDGKEILFDKLLIATGGSPRHLKVPGAELPNVYYLRTVEDADRLHHATEKALREGRLHDKGRGRAVVIGAGLLGVELASTFLQMGLSVDLVMASLHPWPKFAGEIAGRMVARYLENKGARLHTASTPLRLEGDGRVQRIILSERQVIDCDFAAAAIGLAPNKDLLRGTTIAAEKAILVDAYCRTSSPDIYAAGDCAAVFDPLFNKYRLMDHADSAAVTGELAGRNMAGANEPYSTVSSFSSRVGDLTLTVWGEGRLVERRIVRGNPSLESPDLLEIGVASDGRVAQVLAINHPTDAGPLEEMVARRLNVTGLEASLRDPTTDLATLL